MAPDDAGAWEGEATGAPHVAPGGDPATSSALFAAFVPSMRGRGRLVALGGSLPSILEKKNGVMIFASCLCGDASLVLACLPGVPQCCHIIKKGLTLNNSLLPVYALRSKLRIPRDSMLAVMMSELGGGRDESCSSADGGAADGLAVNLWHRSARRCPSSLSQSLNT